VDPDICTTDTPAPPTSGWVDTSEIVSILVERRHPRRDGRDPDGLARRAEFLKLDTAEVIRGRMIVRTSDLARLFTPDALEAVAGDMAGLESRAIGLRDASRLLDLAGLAEADIEALLTRRGVAVEYGTAWQGAVSRGGVLNLARILRAERDLPPDWSDYRPGRPLLGLLRDSMVTDVRYDDRRHVEFRADTEIRERCSAFGIRWAVDRRPDEELMTRTVLEVNSWDVARLLGFEAFERADAPIPDEIAADYRSRMAAAYRQALGLADEPAEAADRAEVEQQPEPRRGRKAVAVS
jgi:hypothetical protein